MNIGKNLMVGGFENLFKIVGVTTVELKLPCVIEVRNFDVHRVLKQLATSLDIKAKWWQDTPEVEGYYTVLYDGRITGETIRILVEAYKAN